MRPYAGVSVAMLTLAWLVGGLMALSAEPAGAGSVTRLPPLELDATTVAPGTTVMLQGTQWPVHQVFQAAVCGRGAFAVSSDCDLSGAVGFGPADNGVVQAALVVAIPPSPCPCVVMITRAHPYAVERLPLRIVGAPSAPLSTPRPLADSRVRVTHVQVLSENSWTSWFGAAAARTLVLTVHNGSAVPVHPLVVARWTDGSDHHPITTPQPRLLPPGATERMSLPFALSTFADGTFPVVGQVNDATFTRRFADATSTTPWALDVAAVVLAVGALLGLGAFMGGRRRGTVDLTGSADDETVGPRVADSGSRYPNEDPTELISTGAVQQ